MSKAEDRALEVYPKETRDVTGFVVDIGCPQYMRDLYIEGYHQAEKDNELTWEDIELIYNITYDESRNVALKKGGEISEQEFYQEVLKRFKAQKGEEV